MCILFTPLTALADFGPPLQGEDGLGSVATKTGQIVGLLSGWAAGLFVIVFIVGGIMYITSAGNPQRAETAKKTLTAGVIGLIIILFAWVLVQQAANLAGGK